MANALERSLARHGAGYGVDGSQARNANYALSAFWGLDSQSYETEMLQRYGSATRGQEVTAACKAAFQSPASMQLGTVLRKSNVRLSMNQEFNGLTETRRRFVAHSASLPDIAKNKEQKQRLSKSHLDHAYGHAKSCRDWQSQQKDDGARDHDKKFGCAKPEGLAHLEKELRKSSVPIFGVRSEHAGCHSWQDAFPKSTEQNTQYNQKPPAFDPQDKLNTQERMRDLRASHIDITNGRANESVAHWKGVSSANMEAGGSGKWGAKAPQGYQHLGKDLRRSNMYMGNDPGPLDARPRGG